MRGWENVTNADIEQLKKQKDNFAFEQKKSKYGAYKTLEDGILFDSKHESEIYKELKMLERAGKIDNLRLQVPFELQPAYEIDGEKRRAITYVADFVYTDCQTRQNGGRRCKRYAYTSI